MNKRELICIVCPRGCALSVDVDASGRTQSVSGNLCPRGKIYAEKECTNPERVVTTTVRCSDGEVISCKTSSAVPKALVFDVMKIINSKIVDEKIGIGDVIIKNILNTGADVVATSNKNK